MKNIATVNSMTTNGGAAAANQYEIRQGDYIIFQSYDSTIAVVNYKDMSITFGQDWDYSRSTSKYLYDFLNSHGVMIRSKKEVEQMIAGGHYDRMRDSFTIIYDENL